MRDFNLEIILRDYNGIAIDNRGIQWKYLCSSKEGGYFWVMGIGGINCFYPGDDSGSFFNTPGLVTLSMEDGTCPDRKLYTIDEDDPSWKMQRLSKQLETFSRDEKNKFFRDQLGFDLDSVMENKK